MESSYSIYQVKDGLRRGIRFASLELLKEEGGIVDRGNYELVYARQFVDRDDMSDARILYGLMVKFNSAHPMDFTGRSLSVSDVVVLRRFDRVSAHYADSVGYQEVPEFLNGPYRYYSTQRPIDIGTFPKTPDGPGRMENYGARIPVEDGAFVAWGVLEYPTALPRSKALDYELRPAFDNPDRYRRPPRQFDARVQAVGRWEHETESPKGGNITQWNPDMGRYVLTDSVERDRANIRYEFLERINRPSIAEQFGMAARQAEKDNAARPSPGKKPGIDR